MEARDMITGYSLASALIAPVFLLPFFVGRVLRACRCWHFPHCLGCRYEFL